MLPVVGVLYALSTATIAQQMNLVYEWNLLKYNIPPYYPINGSFRADRSLIFSAEVGFDHIYFAVPKAFTDNPASLVYVPHTADKNPPLEAYPSWDWHVSSIAGLPITNLTCYGFISVIKLRVDRCARLWALDTGILYHMSPKRRDVICPPKLVAFDLNTHLEVRRVELRKDVVKVNSLVSNFVIDDMDRSGAQPQGNCDAGHIYIAEQDAPGIIVYNMQTKEMWRHSDPTFFSHPEHSKITHATGETEIRMFGIFGMDLSSPGLGSNRDLLYNAVSSKTVYAVNTAVLKKRPNPAYLLELPIRRVMEKPQSFALCYDPKGNALIFSPFNETMILSWSMEDSKYTVLSSDPVALQGVSTIHSAMLDDNNIWVVSTKLAKAVYNTVNPKAVNQRVLRIKTAEKESKSTRTGIKMPRAWTRSHHSPPKFGGPLNMEGNLIDSFLRHTLKETEAHKYELG